MRQLCLALSVATLACSAPSLQPELAQAEAHERAGRHDDALAAYLRAGERCGEVSDLRRRYETCRSAYLGRAELLNRIGRRDQAAEEYEKIPTILPDHANASAEALYRGGRLFLELGKDERGYTLLWRSVTNYPDEEFAGDALKIIIRDGRKRNPKQLHDELAKLGPALSETGIADNLLYHMADIAENELAEPALALGHYDLIAERYSKGGLVDDALWHGARLSRLAGDAAGAVKRLRTLQSTREIAFGTGSYLSIWHDDGQLELGRVLRDDLKDLRRAARVFRNLPKRYPDSILHDDARFEEAETWARLGDSARACRALDRLRAKHPDSKYELARAPTLRQKLGCSTAANDPK